MLSRSLRIVVLLGLLPAGVLAERPDEENENENEQVLRRKTALLRACPKRFATFQGADASRCEVELLMEGEKDTRVWAVDPGAEVKVLGFWGRLEELRPGDRVWAWIRLDRSQRPVSLFLLADEVSEQVIHGLPYSLHAVSPEERSVVLEREGDTLRTLALHESLRVSEKEPGVFLFSSADGDAPHQPEARIRLGGPAFVQTRGDLLRILVGEQGLDTLREGQATRLRERWRVEGLPATAGFVHRLAGEVEVLLDHEAMRWGRHLMRGDGVVLQLAPPARGVVMDVRPWCERTGLRLAVGGEELAGLAAGERLFVRVPEPPAEVAASPLPPDLDRARSRAERIDWFLATIYCTCSIDGDGCTGMFYTLAGCNPKTCGMPQRTRQVLGKLIDEGLSDREIFARLEEERGRLLLRQHLLR